MSAILIISPENWDAHFVSKHHYARTLAGLGKKVFFLNPPDKAARGIVVRPLPVQNLFIVNSPAIAPGLRFWPPLFRQFVERKWLQRLENIVGMAIDVVWLFENSRFFDMRFAGSRIKIYHQVDLNQTFNPLVAARTADVCFCTTDLIAERLRVVRKDVHKIHHGTVIVSEPHLSQRYPESHGGRLCASYVGNLDIPYIDADGLSQIVIAHPEISFNFIGGYTSKTILRRNLRDAPNVTWWGKQPFSEIPRFLAESTLLLVAYKHEYWRQVASPHKFMEYLLAGKVIVCSYTDEYKDKTDIVAMGYPDESYPDLFERVLQNLDRFTTPELAQLRVDFATIHTYERQVQKIFAIVAQMVGRAF